MHHAADRRSADGVYCATGAVSGTITAQGRRYVRCRSVRAGLRGKPGRKRRVHGLPHHPAGSLRLINGDNARVERGGLEPPTSAVRGQRSPS